MRESLFHSAFRAFFMVLFGIMGLTVGIFFMLLVFAGTTSTTDGTPEITYSYSLEVLPNAEGIRKELSNDAPVILQLNINGVIGMEGFTQEAIRQQLIESGERELKGRVKAILLNINTPGGTVVDADGIYRAIMKYKEVHKVPVFAYVDGMCASGGMYVAASADKVVASDVSLVGSVGVILPTILNFSKLLDKFGIETMTLYDGKGKDNLNPLRPWVKGEEDNIKAATKYYYEMFVNIVTKHRPQLDKTQLVNDYGANIYPAAIAKEYGYIDEVGLSWADTVKQLAEKIEIKDDYYQVVSMDNKSWFMHLFKGSFSVLSGQITHKLDFGPGMDPKLSNQYLYLYQP